MAFRAFSICVFVGCAAVGAAQVTVPLDSLNLGGNPYIEVGPSLTFANVGGSGVDVSFVQNTDLRAYDLSQYGGSAWTGPGLIGLIDMPWTTFSNPGGTDIDFSAPVSNFSLNAGDFGGDSDTPLEIQAYDSIGNLIGTATSDWGAGVFPPFATLSVNVSGISRIHYSSGGQFPGSTFYNEVTFTPAPEPATVVVLGAAILGVLRRRTR